MACPQYQKPCLPLTAFIFMLLIRLPLRFGGQRAANHTLDEERPDRASSAIATPPPTERRPLPSPSPAPPDPAAPAQRLRAATWINGRSALGVCLVLAAVLAGVSSSTAPSGWSPYGDHLVHLLVCPSGYGSG